jgi:hypothetical protein
MVPARTFAGLTLLFAVIAGVLFGLGGGARRPRLADAGGSDGARPLQRAIDARRRAFDGRARVPASGAVLPVTGQLWANQRPRSPHRVVVAAHAAGSDSDWGVYSTGLVGI